ncbi:MAG: CBS domain-containing protein [Candidatus Bathyarchaeota archaeon]|nr:CBS domain-containing protein [Candidatus Bathyarchaeota archaeon]
MAISGALIRKLRVEVGLTQERLARLVGVSQAHIAKIERGVVDPRLSTVNRILQVLDGWKSRRCRDIMSSGVIFARLKDRVLDVSDKMVKHCISQVPVIERGRVVGTVTEESIMRRLGSDVDKRTVKEVMVSPLPIVSEETDVEKIKGLLKSYQGVLVSRGMRIVGIITRSDLLKFLCEPA